MSVQCTDITINGDFIIENTEVFNITVSSTDSSVQILLATSPVNIIDRTSKNAIEQHSIRIEVQYSKIIVWTSWIRQ